MSGKLTAAILNFSAGCQWCNFHGGTPVGPSKLYFIFFVVPFFYLADYVLGVTTQQPAQ